MPPLDPLFVDSKTARRLLGQKKTKFFQHLKSGRLVRVLDGRKLLIPMWSVRAFAEQTATPLRAPDPNPEHESSRKPARKQATKRSTAQHRHPGKSAQAERHPSDHPAGGAQVSAPEFDDSWLTLAGVTAEQR